jgi:uncharacterized protein YqgC (DUF456 family)
MMSIPWLIVSSLFFLAGFWGIIIPIIPDLPIIWLGVLVYAVATRFAEISLSTVLWLGALSATTYIIDYLGTALGAKRYGASRQGMAVGLIGGILGLIVFPPFGLVVGAVAGTIFAEMYLAGRSSDAAIRASKGALLGLVFGLLAKVAIAGIIIGVFLGSIL